MKFQRKHEKREPGWVSRHGETARGDLWTSKELAAELRRLWPTARGITTVAVEKWVTPAERHHAADSRGRVSLVAWHEPITEDDVEDHSFWLSEHRPWNGRLGAIAEKLQQLQGAHFPWETR